MAHCVSHPTAPFLSRSGNLEVHQIPAASDNLIWLIRYNEQGHVAAVDGPSASEVLDYCQAQGLTLTTILNTHTHPDHIGLNRELAERGLLDGIIVYGSNNAPETIPGLTHSIGHGDTLSLGNTTGDVLLTEGHINGHISFVFEDLLFCGDTLFAGGCGYLFDGPPATMYASLNQLVQLPESTKVCCAHEYTQDNLTFAWSVEPDNASLAARIQKVWKLRAAGYSSVPSTIGEERDTNPFVRQHSQTLKQRVAEGLNRDIGTTPEEIFAATRALKDSRAYKSDETLKLPV